MCPALSAKSGSSEKDMANSIALSVPYLLNRSAIIDVITVLSAITEISDSLIAYSLPLNDNATPP